MTWRGKQCLALHHQRAPPSLHAHFNMRARRSALANDIASCFPNRLQAKQRTRRDLLAPHFLHTIRNCSSRRASCHPKDVKWGAEGVDRVRGHGVPTFRTHGARSRSDRVQQMCTQIRVRGTELFGGGLPLLSAEHADFKAMNAVSGVLDPL